MRMYLQTPARIEASVNELCLQWIAEHVQCVTRLSTRLDRLPADHLLRFALEYHLGVYALYAAQVKWHYPNLVGDEHLNMRDRYMHGEDHCYTVQLSDESIQAIRSDVAFVTQLAPKLKLQLDSLPLDTVTT